MSLPDIRLVERIAGFAREDATKAVSNAIDNFEDMVARGMPAAAARAAPDVLVLFPGNPLLTDQLALTSPDGPGEQRHAAASGATTRELRVRASGGYRD